MAQTNPKFSNPVDVLVKNSWLLAATSSKTPCAALWDLAPGEGGSLSTLSAHSELNLHSHLNMCFVVWF